MNSNTEEKEGFDKFLTDESEAEEGVEYIKPELELALPAKKRQECREIVREIKEFGVTGQRQLLYLIFLLSLEVEDHDTMKKLTSTCKESRKNLKEHKKLILDG